MWQPLKTLPVYDTFRKYMRRLPTGVKRLYFLFHSFLLGTGHSLFQRAIQYLANGFLQNVFKERAYRRRTDAGSTSSTADRIALSHTTCTVELGHSIILVYAHRLKCSNKNEVMTCMPTKLVCHTTHLT